MKRDAFVGAFCALLFTNIPFATNSKDIEVLIRKCALHDMDACSDLSAAVPNLNDQELLAKIAVEDRDAVVRLAAVEKLTDRALLAMVGLKAEDDGYTGYIRHKGIAAMDDSDPAMKSLVGFHGGTLDAGEWIARIRLAIQEPRIRSRFPRIVFAARVSLLWQGYYLGANMPGESVSFVLSHGGETLAKKKWSTNFPDSLYLSQDHATHARSAGAYDFLPADVHGEDLLAELLHNAVFTQVDLAELCSSEIPELPQAALRNVTDQALLAKVAVENKDYDVRVAAVHNLTDQALLVKFALSGDGRHIPRDAAVETLTDEAALAKVALESEDAHIRQAASAKVIDPALRAKIAAEDEARAASERRRLRNLFVVAALLILLTILGMPLLAKLTGQ